MQAKRKAADRLGVHDVSVLPKNVEIEAALRAHQRLFGRDSHDHTLKEQRRIALDTMRLLEEFQPRLVGSVLTGTATNYSDINLHLFADRSESVAIRLIEIGVPHQFYERRVKMDAERTVNYPALRFETNGRTVDATVFPIDGIRQSPVFAGRRAADEAGRRARSIGSGRRRLSRGVIDRPRTPTAPGRGAPLSSRAPGRAALPLRNFLDYR